MILLGKIVRYFLWLGLFVLLGSFFVGFIRFKGNFYEYVMYLNSLEIHTLFSGKVVGNSVVQPQLSDEELFEQVLLEYTGDIVDASSGEDVSYGFSVPSSEVFTSSDVDGDTSLSVSKEDLLDLVISHEK